MIQWLCNCSQPVFPSGVKLQPKKIVSHSSGKITPNCIKSFSFFSPRHVLCFCFFKSSFMLVVVNTIQSPGHISAGVAQYTFSHDLHLSASHTWHIHIHSLSPRSPSPKWCLLFCFRAFTRDSSKSFNYLFVNDNKEGGSHVAKMSWKWFKYRIKNVKQSKYFWGKKNIQG